MVLDFLFNHNIFIHISFLNNSACITSVSTWIKRGLELHCLSYQVNKVKKYIYWVFKTKNKKVYFQSARGSANWS